MLICINSFCLDDLMRLKKVINDKYAKEDKDREDSVKNAKIQMTSDAIGVIGELASSFAGKSELVEIL